MNIICLGDSLTFGYGVWRSDCWVTLVANATGLRVLNRGTNGDTSAYMYQRAKRRIVPYETEPGDIAIIMGGANDTLMYGADENDVKNILNIAELFSAKNCTPIIGIQPGFKPSLEPFYGPMDLNKLNDISKDVLLKIPAGELADFLGEWSSAYAPDYAAVFGDKAYLTQILDLGRQDKKPRKDLIYGRQIMDFISYFYDDFFRIEDDIPAEVPAEDVSVILSKYLEGYDHSDDQSEWFGKIRQIAVDLGYAAKPKDYKKHPEDYKGHVGHVSTVIRIALMGRAQSPDVWTIQQIMGEETTRRRIESYGR